MRRFIAAITDTISTRFGARAGGNIVTGLATLALRASSLARRDLLWLTGQAPDGIHVADMHHVQPAVAVAGPARRLEHYCPSRLWSHPTWRPVAPGSGAKPRVFGA